MQTLTETQVKAVIFARDIAAIARTTLAQNADKGTKARPTVQQINHTLERLQSIENLLNEALKPNGLNAPNVVKALDDLLTAAEAYLAASDGSETGYLMNTMADARDTLSKARAAAQP